MVAASPVIVLLSSPKRKLSPQARLVEAQYHSPLRGSPGRRSSITCRRVSLGDFERSPSSTASPTSSPSRCSQSSADLENQSLQVIGDESVLAVHGFQCSPNRCDVRTRSPEAAAAPPEALALTEAADNVSLFVAFATAGMTRHRRPLLSYITSEDFPEAPVLAFNEFTVTFLNLFAAWLAGLNAYPFGDLAALVHDVSAVAVAIIIIIALVKFGIAIFLATQCQIVRVQGAADVSAAMSGITVVVSCMWGSSASLRSGDEAASEMLVCSKTTVQLASIFTMAFINVCSVLLCIMHGRRHGFADKPKLCWSKLPRRAFAEVPNNVATYFSSCPICLEEFGATDKVVALPCSHFFHCRCAKEWLRRGHSCPFRCVQCDETPPAAAEAQPERSRAFPARSWAAAAVAAAVAAEAAIEAGRRPAVEII